MASGMVVRRRSDRLPARSSLLREAESRAGLTSGGDAAEGTGDARASTAATSKCVLEGRADISAAGDTSAVGVSARGRAASSVKSPWRALAERCEGEGAGDGSVLLRCRGVGCRGVFLPSESSLSTVRSASMLRYVASNAPP